MHAVAELTPQSLVQGRYRIEGALGRGGFGAVYRAEQLATGQAVALKVLLPSRAEGARAEREAARFTREMKLVGQVSHPNVVRLLDFGALDDGRLYTAFEYIGGENLADLVDREGPIPVCECVRLMRQVLEALAAAHRQGVIHRDLKPQNIMVSDHGPRANARVLDFGVSYIAEEWRDADYRTLTAHEEVAGTPHYMAPEQLLYGDAGVRSDVYAWGLVFLEALTGWPAHGEASVVKLLLRHTQGVPVFVPPPLAGSPLGPVLARATAFAPEERYPSVEAALEDLEAVDLRGYDVAALEQALRRGPDAYRDELAVSVEHAARGGAWAQGGSDLSIDGAVLTPDRRLAAPEADTQLASHPRAPRREMAEPPLPVSSPQPAAPDPIEAGNRALVSGEWGTARDTFNAALKAGESAEALFGLATAEWWLGNMDGTIACLERAYAMFRRRPDPFFAAVTAMRLAGHYGAHFGNLPVAAGWFARACRLIDEHDLTPLQGDQLIIKAKLDPDPAAGEALVRQALDMARQSGQLALELRALSALGGLLISQGRVAEGTPLLDEAMAASLAGEAGDLDTVVFACCVTINSCTSCADFERAARWIRAAERFTERYGCPFLSAECRMVYGNVLLGTGDWDRAEQALRTAMDMARGELPAYYARSAALLAELRLAQGRVDEACELLKGLEDDGEATAALARLHLLDGRPALAASTVKRRLDLVGAQQLDSGILLELLGEAQIALGLEEAAVGYGRTLAALGASKGCKILEARGERLQGLALRGIDPAACKRHLDGALAEFLRLGMRYEAARTRLGYAETVADSQPALAESEARAALATFQRLGAQRDAERATRLVAGLRS